LDLITIIIIIIIITWTCFGHFISTSNRDRRP